MPLINCEVNLILTWSRVTILTNSRNEENYMFQL